MNKGGAEANQNNKEAFKGNIYFLAIASDFSGKWYICALAFNTKMFHSMRKCFLFVNLVYKHK